MEVYLPYYPQSVRPPELCCKSLDGIATEISLIFKPPASNLLWLVVEAHGYHDDTVATVLYWRITAGKTQASLTKAASGVLAASIYWELYRDEMAARSNALPYLLSDSNFASLWANVGALSAGKKLHIRSLVWEYQLT